MSKLEQLNIVLADVLNVDTASFTEQTELLGALPEFDSMAIIGLITAIEQTFNVEVDDEDLSAELFETVGSVLAYIEQA